MHPAVVRKNNLTAITKHRRFTAEKLMSLYNSVEENMSSSDFKILAHPQDRDSLAESNLNSNPSTHKHNLITEVPHSSNHRYLAITNGNSHRVETSCVTPAKKLQHLKELKVKQQIDSFEIRQLRAENEQLKARIKKLEQVIKDDENYKQQVFQQSGRTASMEQLNRQLREYESINLDEQYRRQQAGKQNGEYSGLG